jgi:hypothetical protein
MKQDPLQSFRELISLIPIDDHTCEAWNGIGDDKEHYMKCMPDSLWIDKVESFLLSYDDERAKEARSQAFHELEKEIEGVKKNKLYWSEDEGMPKHVVEGIAYNEALDSIIEIIRKKK